MTYNVFGGTLNLTQPSTMHLKLALQHSVYHLRPSSFKFAIQELFEMRQKNARNAPEFLINKTCNLQNAHLG